MSSRFAHWKLGFIAAAIVVVVTSIPQLGVIIKRGTAWEGSYAILDFDEVSYSAYANALVEGYPRRNNPYLGKEFDQAKLGESYFSIQLLPVFAIAIPARLFNIKTSTIFILLRPLMAFASSLAIFWLLLQVTKSETFSAVGTLIVLLCGRLASESPLVPSQYYSTFSFLRLYLPALPFPLFFIFCGLIWRAFIFKSTKVAVGAGLVLALLIYSYFYLWTAAAAWALCLAIVCMIALPANRRAIFKYCLILIGITSLALGPYLYLLSLRATTIDQDQALTSSRMPDLFRVPEIISLIVIVILSVQIFRRRIDISCPRVLFFGACALAPLIVFNQQIVTGLSLQPFHYEQFIINYVAIIGIAGTFFMAWPQTRIRPILWVAFALAVGLTTAIKEVRDNLGLNLVRDQARPIFEYLGKSNHSGAALFNNSLLAASALTDSTVPQLWAPNMYIYGGVSHEEEIERFYQYLYLMSVEPQVFEHDLLNNIQMRATVFGLHRVNVALTHSAKPITDDEIRNQVDSYSAYVKDFSSQHAARWPLAYVITMGEDYQLTNLDRWYIRGAGEKVGNCTIYPVKLKPQP